MEDTDINNTPLNLSNDGNRSVANQSTSFKGPVDLTIKESAVENMSKVSNKRKLEKEHSTSIPLVKKLNFLPELENQIHEDVNKDETSQHVPFVIQHTQSQYFQCTDCPQVDGFHSSQFGIVNSAIPEDKTYQNPSIQEKNKYPIISNDSGISIQGTPSPTLVLCDSLEAETEAALVNVDECHALDLRTTSDAIIKVRELTDNDYDEICAMSESNRSELHPPCEMPVGVHMPPFNPDRPGNKPLTNADIDVAYVKSGDLEMPNVVPESKCQTNSQDTCSNNVAVDNAIVAVDDTNIAVDDANVAVDDANVAVDNANVAVDNVVGDAKQLKILEKSEHNVDLSKDTACDSIPNDFTNEAVNSSNGFEAVTVAIGTFGEAPHILHGSESDANLQNISQVTSEPVSCENQNLKELKDKEELNILHIDAYKVDIQNANPLTFSPEHKNIQQEAVCSKSERENIDIGTFENSGNLNTSHILHDCKNDNSPSTSSSTNVTNPLLPIECENK